MTEKERQRWREKCFLLSQMNPAAFSVKEISKKELTHLSKNLSIPAQPHTFDSKKYYFFYCEKYVYGIFKPIGFKNHCVLFRNLTQYKNPLRLWGVHRDKSRLREALGKKTQLINMLEKENFCPKTLLMVIKKSQNALSQNALSLYVASENINHLIQHSDITDPEKLATTQSLFEKSTKILNEEYHHHKEEEKEFEHLLSLGAKLNKMLFHHPHWSKIIHNFNSIKLVNQSFLPIYTWHYPQQKENLKENSFLENNFPFVRSKTTHYAHLEKDKLSSHQDRVINSLAVVDFIDDSLSQLELNAIQKRQAHCIKKEMQVSYLSGKMHDWKTIFATHDFVHLIANGREKDGDLLFCDEKNPVFSGQDFRFFGKMPKVLFLSMCFSENAKIIKHFFDHGGQSLIVSAGLLSTRDLHYYVSTFYWQLFSARHSVATAFHSMIYKFFNKRNLNAFRLRLYGDGQEFFVGKRDFGENPMPMRLQ